MSDEKHRCGRRDDMTLWLAAQRGEKLDTSSLPKPDTFKLRDAEKYPHSMGAGQRCCSYCGSMHPADFLDAIRAGAVVGPTDKNYKVYVEGLPGGKHHKFYFQHLDDAQQASFVELYNSQTMKIGFPGHFYVLPFFMRRAS